MEQGKEHGYNFRTSPAMPSAHYMSGLALLATGKFKEAKPLLGAVVGVNVEGLSLEDPDQVDETVPGEEDVQPEGNESE